MLNSCENVSRFSKSTPLSDGSMNSNRGSPTFFLASGEQPKSVSVTTHQPSTAARDIRSTNMNLRNLISALIQPLIYTNYQFNGEVYCLQRRLCYFTLCVLCEESRWSMRFKKLSLKHIEHIEST